MGTTGGSTYPQMIASQILYHFSLRWMWWGIALASLFSSKIKKLYRGATSSHRVLKAWKPRPQSKILWVHCASLGEFEQAKPVLEWIKAEMKQVSIVLTFFSPSGYEIKKNEPLADLVLYLPPDLPHLAKEWIQVLQPNYVIFVKYDFWYNLLSTAHQQGAQMICISAAFRADQSFFAWYGGLFRHMLKFFDKLFLQNLDSITLLEKAGITQGVFAGDTRYDRVSAIAAHQEEIEALNDWTKGSKVLVAGSVWPEDMEALKDSFPLFDKVILAPHDVSPSGISTITKHLNQDFGYFSNFESAKNLLIVDSIGWLSRMYRYATVAYVGGAFKQGLHNILEPAAWSVPVVFGPQLRKYPEASALIKSGGGYSINSAESCKNALIEILKNPDKSGKNSLDFIQKHKGAVHIITQYIEQTWKG